MVRLNLFGSASIDVAGVPVSGRAAHGRRLALLTLLACARGRSLTRDRLTAVLWPDTAPERARRQLSDDVYIVRSALGDAALRSAGDELALDPAVISSDVETFERLLDAGSFEDAAALVTGPLLDGFLLPDGAEFERWLDGERARLGRRYATALQSLADANETRGDAAAAAAWWRKLAGHDPYDSRVALGLVRALDAAGDRAGALRHARLHTTLLREEFDAEPEPEIAALAERLRVEPGAGPPGGRTVAAPATSRVVAPATSPAPAPGSRVVAAPAGSAIEDPVAAPPVLPASRRRTRRYAAAVVLLLVAAAAGALVVNAQREATSSPPTTPVAAPSVGVLPFVNMSADPDNTYFSDGLTEQIISALSRIDGLQVAARTSSFALRDGRLDARAIGDALGVAAVLEGSVRAHGDRLRITAQLIDAATGYHVWTGEYDRELQDVFAVQEEIAGAIATALQLRLAGGGSPARAAPAVDLAAYDLYLRGLYMRNSLSGDALRQASDFFDRAIEREPGFAPAYAAKASVIAPLVLFGHTSPEEGLNELRALIARALELDSTLGEAYAAQGVLKLFYEWDWSAAEQALLRAIELNPSDAHAYHHLANYLRAMGRANEAVAARSRAAALDPLNPRTIVTLAGDYAVAGDHEHAVAAYDRARRLDPTHVLALGSGPFLPSSVADVYLQQGRETEAVEELLRIATLRGATAGELDALRHGFAAGGMTGFWRSWLDMDVRQSGGAADPLRLARLWVLSGDTARAIAALERAYAERNPGLILLNADPLLRTLHADPRVARMLAAMRFPPGA